MAGDTREAYDAAVLIRANSFYGVEDDGRAIEGYSPEPKQRKKQLKTSLS